MRALGFEREVLAVVIWICQYEIEAPTQLVGGGPSFLSLVVINPKRTSWEVGVEREGKPFFFLLLTMNPFHPFHSSTSFPQNDLCDRNQVCNKTTWPCAQSVLALVNSHLFYFNILTNLYWKQLFLVFTFSWNKTLVFVCYFCMLHTWGNMSKNCIIPESLLKNCKDN